MPSEEENKKLIKDLIRKDCSLKRRQLPVRSLNPDLIFNMKEFINADYIFCYVSFGSEISTTEFIKFVLDSGKKLVVPRCKDKNGNMEAVRLYGESDLCIGTFGIYEPVNGSPIDSRLIDFAIIPALSFDHAGYRVGYGKGYYDKFMKDISPFKVGVCHKEICAKNIPHEVHDLKCDKVIFL